MTADFSASAGAPESSKRAIDLLREGAFPDGWSFVPVAGKATYVKEWSTKPLTREQCIKAYEARSDYNGIGVVTGNFSTGLIALDIDGPDADLRYKAIAGDEYEPYGEEKTMAWTSGKPGRRQIIYRLPHTIIEELEQLKTLILRQDGEWYLGHSDIDRVAGKATAAPGAKYEECVLRFNQCQSVLPGSVHPDGGRYQWLNYHDKQVAKAPGWVMDAVRPYRKPAPFATTEMSKVMEEEFGQTLLPSRQIKGWFYKEEIQAKLRPRLLDLVFKHPVFDQYGWKKREGSHPQYMSGCPWHGGKSGTTFQLSAETGCWDCKACGIEGNPLSFIHKIRTNDMDAPHPMGTALEAYVAELTTALGYSYPEDAKAQVIKEAPRVVMNARDFHEALIKIHDEELNPALRTARMAELAAETGRRLTGAQCLAAMDEYRYYEDSRRQNEKKAWWQNVERMQFLVPNLLARPTQVMLHAAGGLGKTSACMGLATAVGRGTPIRIRGIELPVKQGPVLWIQNDQNPAKLLQDCEDNGIDPARDKWFIVKRGFQINHTHEFAEWIRQYKPALVVVDSIGSCSTKMQVEEKDKGFASPFYYYAEKNGNPDDGFPATSIIWIHHDNANGEARGTRYLVAAVDEQWHLRTTSEDEREALRERRRTPSNCRMIQIKKSRLGRQGDLLVVERDHDFAYSVWDYTPTERREDQGQGDPEPNTMALRIVKDRVREARAEGGDGNDRMTAKEVWERLVEEMGGQGRQAPASKTVKRWLDRWVTNGVLVEGKKRILPGSDKPVTSYSLPPTPSSRALPSLTCPLVSAPRNPLQEQEKAMDNEGSSEDDVHCFGDGQPDQKSNGHQPECEQVVHCNFPVPEGDLRDQGPTDNKTRGKKGSHDRPEPSPTASAVAPELGESPNPPGDLGTEVPRGQDSGRSTLGDDADLEVDDGRPSDCPDVAEQGSPVQRHELDVPFVKPDLPEAPEDWDYDAAFGA